LAKELARQGHEVTVLTTRKEVHDSFEKEHNLIVEDLGESNWKEVKLTGKGTALMFKRCLNRALQIGLEYANLELYFKVKNALRKRRKNKERYDLLISIAVPYPIDWGVAAVWKKKNNIAKTWVADCGDPFMGYENDTFKPAFYFKFVEKWFCKKADFITVPVETAIPAYYPEFHDKIKVISKGCNFEDVDTAEKENNEIPCFAYAGRLI
jgi:hypothetical protein